MGLWEISGSTAEKEDDPKRSGDDKVGRQLDQN